MQKATITKVGTVEQLSDGSYIVEGWHFELPDVGLVWPVEDVGGYSIEELREIAATN